MPPIRNGMIFSTALYVAAVLLLEPLLGLGGLWLALHIFFLGRGGILAFSVWRRLPTLFDAPPADKRD